MNKKITCIECPVGCSLSVDVENCKVVKIDGAKCDKGEKYAIAEIENPVRILTSVVLAEGLSVKMVPVRTTKPMPKAKIPEAMDVIRKMKLTRPVKVGDVVAGDFLGLGIDLVATRDAGIER